MGVRTRKIALTGEIDYFTAPLACRALDELDGPAVVDLSGVTLLGAAGLNELARTGRRLGPRQVVLAGPRPIVRRVLEIAGFDELFTIVDRACDGPG